MAVVLEDLLRGAMPELRVQSIPKRVRGLVGDRVVVDSERVVLVWEPRRVLPQYAVPAEDVLGDLVHCAGSEEAAPDGAVIPPRTPFAVHSTPGTPLTVRAGEVELRGAAFRPDDPDLEGRVVLDSSAMDHWMEEDERVLGHPSDPLHRIECLASSRHVVVRAGDVVIADSTRPVLLLEPPLPVRYYLPRDDVRLDLLTVSDSHTVCPYKGVASYWSVEVDGTTIPDVAWVYEDALHDARPVEGMVCFYPDKVHLDVSI